MRVRLVLVAAATMGLAGSSQGQAAMSADQRIRILEQALRRQQEEIQQLRQELHQQKAVGQATSKQAEQADQKATEIQAAQKASPGAKWADKISLFGDGRIRYEGFFNQPSNAPGGTPVVARNRERLRFRIGATYRYSDELAATIRLVSGNPNDPISSNQSFTDEFTKKPISLDWAYLTFSPGKTFGLRPGAINLTGGKFAVPQFRVGEMVFDDDLSVEGFNEMFQLLDGSYGPLDQIRLWVEQWSFAEIANAQDGWVFGGQVNPIGHVGSVQLEGGIAQWWWLNPDLIAQALNTNNQLFNTNLVVKQTVNGKSQIVAYESGFNQTQLTFAATVPDVVETMPLKFFLDYVYNWQAATDEAQGVMAGVKFGQPKVRGDWAVSALYEYLGQEAAVSSFVWSDFGYGGTNVQGPVFELQYQVLDPFTISARTYLTNYIVARNPPTTNPTLVRLQLEGIVRF
jgi:hypothetical protein